MKDHFLYRSHPIEITRAPIFKAGTRGTQEIGTSITYHTDPPKVIDIYAKRVNVIGGGYDNELTGNVNHKIEDGLLTINVGDRKGNTQVIVYPGGQIITAHTSEPTPTSLTNLLTGKAFAKRLSEQDNSQAFAKVSIDNPGSFDHLTFSQVVRYFNQELGITPEQFAQRTEISPSVLTKLINGDSRIVKSLPTILVGFGLRQDNPRTEIIRQAFRRERARMRDERAARRSIS